MSGRWPVFVVLCGLASPLAGQNTFEQSGTQTQSQLPNGNVLGGSSRDIVEESPPSEVNPPPELPEICTLSGNQQASAILLAGAWTVDVEPGVLVTDGDEQPSNAVNDLPITLDPARGTATFEDAALSSRLLTRAAPPQLGGRQVQEALIDARKLVDRPDCDADLLPRVRATGTTNQGELVMDIDLFLEAVSETRLVGVVKLTVTRRDGVGATSVALHALTARR